MHVEYIFSEKYVVPTRQCTINRLAYEAERSRQYRFRNLSMLYKLDEQSNTGGLLYPAIGGVYTFYCFTDNYEVYIHKNLAMPALICPATSELEPRTISGLVSWCIEAHRFPFKYKMTDPETHTSPERYLSKKFRALINYNVLAASIRVEPGKSYLKYKDWEDWV